MGHDFECSEDGENIYVSYNHCWAFYEFLDEEIISSENVSNEEKSDPLSEN